MSRPGLKVISTNSWRHITGRKNGGCLISDVGCMISDVGCRISGPKIWNLSPYSLLLTPHSSLLTPNSLLPAPDFILTKYSQKRSQLQGLFFHAIFKICIHKVFAPPYKHSYVTGRPETVWCRHDIRFFEV